ncbi:MAG: cytidine deaminase [Desulfobaccales bacterium]|nr:cytidine deaminase [Desulfobaccales bacterium]
MTPSKISAEEKSMLLKAVQEARKHAYAPYSNFRVGAAVLTEKGNIYSGVNVENASYGLTICAERAAIFAAVAAEGNDMKIRALAVFNQSEAPCAPCGACRQVILEFGPQARVFYKGPDGLKEAGITELLPEGFRL